MSQAVINIGTVGHVDHGKTSLVYALTGKWTDTHSEELKRGITIKLGYADVVFYKCGSCEPPDCFTTSPKCPKCGGEARELRKISFVDAPGHETLMATVIAASSIMDAAIFVIAATEACPQPQTQEHLMVLEASGLKKVVVAQNKVDLVSKEQAVKNYGEIQAFLKDSPYENAPIIPTAANSGLNVNALIQAIEENIPTPERDLSLSPRFLIARSFDVNKPGAEYKKLVGGVVGGSLVEGKLAQGDKISVLPGALHQTTKGKEFYEPIVTTIRGLHAGGGEVDEAFPGGLVGVATFLDPSLTKSDALVGCVLGRENEMPPMWSELSVEVSVLQRVLDAFQPSFQPNEPLVVGAGTATSVGFVSPTKQKDVIQLKLNKPICVRKGEKIALLRRSKNRWRLYATGKIV